MAAILRSSVIQTARRAFSGEGTLSVRALHAGRTGRKVGRRSKKIHDVARKDLAVGFTERLKKELTSSTPSLMGNALQCLVTLSAVGAFWLGCQVGSVESYGENSQASSGKQARRP